MSKAKNLGGRPPHEPTDTTRKQVELMVAFGNTFDEIAQIQGITIPTLRVHYRKELDLGLIKANNAVKLNLYRQATKDDPRSFQAMKFWLNCRAGWSEYAPPPAQKPEPLGKKQQANIDAMTAERGTSWEDVTSMPEDGTRH